MKLINMRRSSHARSKTFIILLLLVSGLVAAGFYQYNRPLPQLKPVYKLESLKPVAAPVLAWPEYGQSAIGAQGFGLLGTSGQQTPSPMASVTKIVTALMVLQKKPLDPGQQGPLITLTAEDVEIYQNYISQNGSLVGVAAGEQISQYQALQALLLPSANNMADTLVRWAFGSMDAYVQAANSFLSSMGLSQTRVADASGFSEKSVSTAEELVLLGQAAMAEPVIADIVNQKEASIPVAGVIRNTNRLLGDSGIIGIKTGNTDQAGGCYLFAGKHEVGRQSLVIIGAVLGAPTLDRAMNDGRPLLLRAYDGFSSVGVIKKGQALGYYEVPWTGQGLNAVAERDLDMVTWRSRLPKLNAKLQTIAASTPKNTNVGKLKVLSGSNNVYVPAVLEKSAPKPSWQWRILRN